VILCGHRILFDPPPRFRWFSLHPLLPLNCSWTNCPVRFNSVSSARNDWCTKQNFHLDRRQATLRIPTAANEKTRSPSEGLKRNTVLLSLSEIFPIVIKSLGSHLLQGLSTSVPRIKLPDTQNTRIGRTSLYFAYPLVEIFPFSISNKVSMPWRILQGFSSANLLLRNQSLQTRERCLGCANCLRLDKNAKYRELHLRLGLKRLLCLALASSIKHLEISCSKVSVMMRRIEPTKCTFVGSYLSSQNAVHSSLLLFILDRP
jgi:hypothetical protein